MSTCKHQKPEKMVQTTNKTKIPKIVKNPHANHQKPKINVHIQAPKARKQEQSMSTCTHQKPDNKNSQWPHANTKSPKQEYPMSTCKHQSLKTKIVNVITQLSTLWD